MPSVLQRLQLFNSSLLPETVALKYEAMAEGPYRFFRGTCHLFYEDLSKAPPLPPSPLVWMCGDLHTENLGTFKGDNRLVYFDLNDFDEAMLGPAAWELVRMTASIFVAFQHLEFKPKKALKWATLFLSVYAKTLEEGKAKAIETRTAQGIVERFLTAVGKRKQKDLLRKYSERHKGKLRLSTDGKKRLPIKAEVKQSLLRNIEDWLRNWDESPYNYNVLDACFRAAGTGSLGLKRFMLLLQSKRDPDDFLFLDMKEATQPSPAPFVRIAQPPWENEATRIVTVQKRVQNVSPALLSTNVFMNDSYVMQEMQPVEDKVDFGLIVHHYREVCEVIEVMAVLTASGHLRSAGRQGSAIADELIAFGADKDWQQALLDYSRAYALQVNRDYEAFMQEFRPGS